MDAVVSYTDYFIALCLSELIFNSLLYYINSNGQPYGIETGGLSILS